MSREDVDPIVMTLMEYWFASLNYGCYYFYDFFVAFLQCPFPIEQQAPLVKGVQVFI